MTHALVGTSARARLLKDTVKLSVIVITGSGKQGGEQRVLGSVDRGSVDCII